jgi:hypothetical protein
VTLNIAPYRMLHTFDLKKTDHAQLSKAARVIATLESLLPVENPPVMLRKLGIADSRIKFAAAFDALCLSLTPAASVAEVDKKRYGETSYVTFYDLIVKQKKRTLAQHQENTTVV